MGAASDANVGAGGHADAEAASRVVEARLSQAAAPRSRPATLTPGKADAMADSAKESKDNKRKRGAAAKKEKDREKDRLPPAPPFQDIKLPEKYRLLPVPKADAANAQSDDVVQLSRTAKAPQITLQDDMLTAIGCKGYRMVRATHGVGSGSWYFEVRVNTPLNGEDGHTRLGWCTDMGELQAPVGYDHNSYAYRDRVANAAIGSPGSTLHPNPRCIRQHLAPHAALAA